MASWLADAGSGGAAEYLPADALVAALPFWETFRRRTGTQAAMRGINAAVVQDGRVTDLVMPLQSGVELAARLSTLLAPESDPR